MNCPKCGKEIIDTQARFCPYCAAGLGTGESAEILAQADRETDLTRKRELLLEARRRFPDDFQVEKRLLFQGRLGEKGGKPDETDQLKKPFEVLRMPIASVDDPTGRELVFMGAFLDIIQRFTEEAMTSDRVAYGQGSQGTHSDESRCGHSARCTDGGDGC